MKSFYLFSGLLLVSFLADSTSLLAQSKNSSIQVRFATYNIAMNRKTEGALKDEIASGTSNQSKRIAEVIQRTRPDVLLLCEFDYDAEGAGLTDFQKKYLAVSQNGAKSIQYAHSYFAPVNTGVDSGLDLDGDGKLRTGNDAFGYGVFPGQYAMAVLSKYPIDVARVRTFQKFLWKDMPNALAPKNSDGSNYYSKEAWDVFRLSSKSHWDVPIRIGDSTVHFLASHPTPPVFDGPEDKNGRRNHDEIRLFADYVSGRASYLYDDKGAKGGLAENDHFVIVGDLNADPVDGDSYSNAIGQLLSKPQVNSESVPVSQGGRYYAKSQGGANQKQKGDPAFDTGDFNDRRVGNMRIDYCLPSRTLELKANGVYWPVPGQQGAEAVKASDHRMVWIDVMVKG